MRIIKEGAKLKYASGDFWNRKAEFGVEAEDVTDEIICSWGDGSGSQQVVTIAHESDESSVAEIGAIP